jgi:hypothetical protein
MHQKNRSQQLYEPVGIHGPSNQQLPTAMGERPARLFINMAMNPVNPQLDCCLPIPMSIGFTVNHFNSPNSLAG